MLAQTFERMTESLRGMAEVAGKIADGDLRSNITPQSSRDVLATAFARMIENLRDQTRQLVEGANVLASSASEIVASTTQLASSATESAAAVSETTTTVEKVRQTAQAASQKAKSVADTAQRAAQISQSGRKSTEEVVAGTGRIRHQMEAIATSMVRLSEAKPDHRPDRGNSGRLGGASRICSRSKLAQRSKRPRPENTARDSAWWRKRCKSLAEQSRQATNQECARFWATFRRPRRRQ